jgi:hypothetical protein
MEVYCFFLFFFTVCVLPDAVFNPSFWCFEGFYRTAGRSKFPILRATVSQRIQFLEIYCFFDRLDVCVRSLFLILNMMHSTAVLGDRGKKTNQNKTRGVSNVCGGHAIIGDSSEPQTRRGTQATKQRQLLSERSVMHFSQQQPAIAATVHSGRSGKAAFSRSLSYR